MRRHESLIPLSRFHRSILFLALNLKKNAPPVNGYPTDIEGKVDFTVRFYEVQLKQHIQIEENVLFSFLIGKYQEIDELISDLKNEHEEIRQAILLLQDENNHTREFLDSFGIMLEKHVRKEERQFFQLIQEKIGSKVLDKLNLDSL